MEFHFSAVETLFYTVTFVTASAAGFARLLRDNDVILIRSVLGRCLGSGCLGFGIVSLLIGHSNSVNLSSFYWVAVSTLIGYASKDIQDKIFGIMIAWLLKRFGINDERK